jgi:hypothetical protein
MHEEKKSRNIITNGGMKLAELVAFREIHDQYNVPTSEYELALAGRWRSNRMRSFHKKIQDGKTSHRPLWQNQIMLGTLGFEWTRKDK